MEPAKKVTNTHDLGFMLYCSFGQGYRLTGNKHYLDVINEGTQSLLTRWSEKTGVIKSWDSNPRWQYPVIIDNMMNLEMLCFMTREFSDRRYEQIAEKHAQTTMKNHFRPDFHLDYYNSLVIHPMFTETLQILKKHHLAGADFLPLGLPADDPFWTAPARDWTSKKAWSGQNIVADHAIR